METKISKERYVQILNFVKKDLQRINLDSKTPQEKTKLAELYASENGIIDTEQRCLYLTELLISDENFVDVYLSYNKSASLVAQHYNVEPRIVTMKVLSQSKYKEDAEYQTKNDDFEVRTANAISRINQLLEYSRSQEEKIDNQERNLENKDEEIVRLEEVVASRDAEISSLKLQIDVKDAKITLLQQQIEGKEKEITDLKEKLAKYLSFEKNYERIMSFLEENLNQSDKKPFI